MMFKPLSFRVICYIAVDNTTSIDESREVSEKVRASRGSFLIASIFSAKKGARSSAEAEGVARGNRDLKGDERYRIEARRVNRPRKHSMNDRHHLKLSGHECKVSTVSLTVYLSAITFSWVGAGTESAEIWL